MARHRSRQRDTVRAVKRYWKIGVVVYLALVLASPVEDPLQSASMTDDPVRIGPILVFLGILLAIRVVVRLAGLLRNDTHDMDEIDCMGGHDFEAWLDAAFVRSGYIVDRTPTTGDYGADLIVRRGAGRMAVQAKRSKTPVGVAAIQEVHAAKAHYRCKRAAVVTNSTFTKSARTLARSLGVELWDRDTMSTKLLK